jgi:hypothetical protein
MSFLSVLYSVTQENNLNIRYVNTVKVMWRLSNYAVGKRRPVAYAHLGHLIEHRISNSEVAGSILGHWALSLMEI